MLIHVDSPPPSFSTAEHRTAVPPCPIPSLIPCYVLHLTCQGSGAQQPTSPLQGPNFCPWRGPSGSRIGPEHLEDRPDTEQSDWQAIWRADPVRVIWDDPRWSEIIRVPRSPQYPQYPQLVAMNVNGTLWNWRPSSVFTQIAHLDLTIKAARANQCLIQDVRTVCRCNHHLRRKHAEVDSGSPLLRKGFTILRNSSESLVNWSSFAGPSHQQKNLSTREKSKRFGRLSSNCLWSSTCLTLK